MVVNIVNGTVGLPFFQHPFHVCGNVSNIPNMDLGQRNLRPAFQSISSTLLFKDVFSIDKHQASLTSLQQRLPGTHLLVGSESIIFLLIFPVSPKSAR
jgi:hypothetical protein